MLIRLKSFTKVLTETDLGNLNGLTASANIIINEGQNPDVPMKNQDVKINVDWVTNKAGEKLLAVTSILVPPTAKASAFSFDDEESSEESELTDQALSATGLKPEDS
jgi:hypothetical protein